MQSKFHSVFVWYAASSSSIHLKTALANSTSETAFYFLGFLQCRDANRRIDEESQMTQPCHSLSMILSFGLVVLLTLNLSRNVLLRLRLEQILEQSVICSKPQATFCETTVNCLFTPILYRMLAVGKTPGTLVQLQRPKSMWKLLGTFCRIEDPPTGFPEGTQGSAQPQPRSTTV